MYATQNVTIAVPVEFARELLEMSTDGFRPRMVMTDANVTAAVIRALTIQMDESAGTIRKQHNAMMGTETTVEASQEFAADIMAHVYTAAALYLAVANATIIIHTEKDHG